MDSGVTSSNRVIGDKTIGCNGAIGDEVIGCNEVIGDEVIGCNDTIGDRTIGSNGAIGDAAIGGVLEVLCQFFKLQHNAVRRIDYDRTIRF
ncbi:MAG: hypothetical protein V7723_19615 [Sneathiella sp.]|uniref:hypothetical protein n=1 Tax=Sneathiella sp. TaxID=1964365 RepID=UPI003001D28E